MFTIPVINQLTPSLMIVDKVKWDGLSFLVDVAVMYVFPVVHKMLISLQISYKGAVAGGVLVPFSIIVRRERPCLYGEVHGL